MFEITTPTGAHLSTFNVRNEKHGDDDVLAFSMTLKITGANTFLDTLSPTLRESLYKAVEGQDPLPGVEATTPLLRCKIIEKAALLCSFEGWTLRVAHGIDEDDPIVIGGVKVDKFSVAPKDGGTCETLMRLGSNDIDESEIGKLAGKLGQEISITLSAPEVKKTEPAIDGTTEAFKRDYPNAGADGGAGGGATDLFVAGAAASGESRTGDDAGGEDDGGEAEAGAGGGEDDDGETAASAGGKVAKKRGGRR